MNHGINYGKNRQRISVPIENKGMYSRIDIDIQYGQCFNKKVIMSYKKDN